MADDLLRVESGVTATACGNLTWEKWPHDCATALGLAGRRNPLGFAMVRYLSDEPSAMAVWGVVLVLAKEIERRGVELPPLELKETAFRAFEWWRDKRCPTCFGRGVIQSGKCPTCEGSGERQAPSSPDPLKEAVSALIDAESWMEGQLRARLRR